MARGSARWRSQRCTGPGEYAVGVTWTVEERHAWAFPPTEGVVDGIDLAFVDPADPDERSFLIRSEHPELAEALDSGLDEVVLAGQVMNPQLHLTIHEVVANQLWDGDPPEVAETARRLDLAGYDRHEVFHMIGSVMSEEMWLVMRHQRQADLGQIKQKLAALPGSWGS